MKFTEPRRHNLLDNPLIAIGVHFCALAIAVGAVWSALVHYSLTPLWLGLGALTLMEGIWWYLMFRR